MANTPRRTKADRARPVRLADAAAGHGPLWHGPALPPWLPPAGAEPARVPAGRHFDVVVFDFYAGATMFPFLGDRSGPVISDAAASVLMWLVPCGSGLGVGEGLVLVPPADALNGHAEPRPWWVVPPRGDCLTDPVLLRDAVRARAGNLWAVPRG